MKNLITIIFSVILVTIIIDESYGQKIMKLESELKSGSTPLEAKRKAFGSVGKYQFGSYRIVSGKSGWTTTKPSSKFFSSETKSESKKKSSFVFVSNDKDTIQVSTSTNTKTIESTWGDFSRLNLSSDNYLSVFSMNNDTTVWRMIILAQKGAVVKNNFSAEGILTNGQKTIQIREVRQWEDGKVPMFKLIIGYEFFLDQHSIAAVQSSPDSFQKKFVWLHKDLDEKMKSIIAAASASIMLYSEESMGSLDR